MPKMTPPPVETRPPAASPQARRHDETFRRAAVENWLTSGKSGRQIAAELGISYPSLKEWRRRADGAALPRRDDPVAEIRALKAELARVREQRDILKQTVGSFSAPSKTATGPSRT